MVASRFSLFAWAVLVLVMLVFASAPTAPVVQMLLGAVAIVTVIALKPFASNLTARFALLAVASLLVARYWLWRVTQTLPSPDISLEFVLAVLLLAVETYSIFVFFLNCFISADPTVRSLPDTVPSDDLPTVDILIPTYNEPLEMLAITASAAKNIIYPSHKRTVVLCDDGGTDARCESADMDVAIAARERRAQLQVLCAELGIVYSTRPDNLHAKAGNLSEAMQKLSGQFVVILDADHVPSRDFLARTIGYFHADPKLALVQTPHFFINKDPIERNVGLGDTCPPEYEAFYSLIHRGLDRWGGAFFCGSASVLRRAALDDIGGFSGDTITEDAETTVDLHARGWRSLYVDHAMIAGLQPETLASLVQQRGRWATGMIQILMLKRPMFRTGLSLMQRLCYLNSMTYWFFPFVRLTYLLVPLAFLVFGLEVFVTDVTSALAYLPSYILVSFLVQNALFSRHRWPFISEIYEIAQAPYLARAVAGALLQPKGATFKVTAKDETLAENFVSEIHLPLTLLTALTGVGAAAFCYRLATFEGNLDSILFVGFWAVINFLLTATAWLAVSEKQQRRASPRLPVRRDAVIRGIKDSEGLLGAVVEASTTGAKLSLKPSPALAGIEVGSVLSFEPIFPEATHLQRPINVVVRNVQRRGATLDLGVQIRSDQPLSTLEALAYLMFGDSEVWQSIRTERRSGKGLTSGTLFVLSLFPKGVGQLLVAFLREPARRLRKAKTEARATRPVHLLAFGQEADVFAGPASSGSESRDRQSGLSVAEGIPA